MKDFILLSVSKFEVMFSKFENSIEDLSNKIF